LILKRRAVVIDNGADFRMDPSVPLVIPELNPEDLEWHKGLIANPNCSTIIMLMALFPIHRVSPIKRTIISTYQAVSGTGKAAKEELEEQILSTIIIHEDGRSVMRERVSSMVEPRVYPSDCF